MEKLFRIIFNLERQKSVTDTTTRRDNVILLLVLLAASAVTFFTGMWFLTVFASIGFVYICLDILFSGESKTS